MGMDEWRRCVGWDRRRSEVGTLMFIMGMAISKFRRSSESELLHMSLSIMRGSTSFLINSSVP